MNDGLYDEGPDEPPTGGFHDPERRHRPRRTEDAIARDMEGWVARLFIYRGRIIALVSSVTFLFTALGFRILGPSQDLKALDQKFTAKDSLMSVRVGRIEDTQAQVLKNQQDMAVSIQFLTYLQCRQMPRDDRPATCYVRGQEP